MIVIAASITKTAHEMLERYAKQANRNIETLAGDIITTSMIHFSAGVCEGLDHASKIADKIEPSSLPPVRS